MHRVYQTKFAMSSELLTGRPVQLPAFRAVCASKGCHCGHVTEVFESHAAAAGITLEQAELLDALFAGPESTGRSSQALQHQRAADHVPALRAPACCLGVLVRGLGCRPGAHSLTLQSGTAECAALSRSSAFTRGAAACQLRPDLCVLSFSELNKGGVSEMILFIKKEKAEC